MANLNIKNSFSITVRGKEIVGWQGTDAANDANDVFTLTVDGKTEYQSTQLADAAAATLWDEDSDLPANFDFLFIVADQDLDLQLIANSLHVVLQLKAGVPFVLGYDDVLVAVNTTEIVADATPSYEDIDSVRINNRSGTDANYVFFLVD